MNLKIVQCGIDRDSPREAQSIKQLKQLGNDLNIRYIHIENPRYEWDAPTDNIYKKWAGSYAGKITENLGWKLQLTDYNYGCWLSHRQALSVGFADRDHTLVCEADCRILDMDLFKQRLQEAVNLLNSGVDYHLVRFEPPFYPIGIETEFFNQVSENIYECHNIFSGHCHLINKNSKAFFSALYELEGWTTNDDWLNWGLADRGHRLDRDWETQ